ncbi:MAG: hypothetical protein KJO77_06555 [Bacteroidia bacterium]|nr:hypothetical protein [Bacteroidia bacterium]NND52913.1 hypothetical protein [Flavobacteriaceae bacterium]
MLRKLLVFVFALGALNATANTITAADPIEDYLTLEIEKLELENELFGIMSNDEIVSIASIAVFELNESLELDINTKQYLPADFNAKEGMEDIDWDTIELFEIEDEFELEFNTKDHLPKDFKFAKRLVCDNVSSVELDN